MKKTCLLGLLCLSTALALAQKIVPVSNNSNTTWKNLITGTEVKATEFVFPENIYQYDVHPSSDLVAVQLRGIKGHSKIYRNTGKLVMLDLNSRTAKWSKNINYTENAVLQDDGVLIFIKFNNRSMRLNPEDGKELWSIDKEVFYMDHLTGMAIGYPLTSPGYTETLQGYRLSDGKLRWNRKVSREYGWNEIQHLNDSTILLGAGGLHSIQLKTGFGFDYKAVTASKDYTEMIIANAVGIFVSAVTGSYPNFYGGYDLVADVCSNVYIDSLDYYFASRENIARLDSKLRPVWSTEILKRNASKSSIFIQDGLLYMINLGHAFAGGNIKLFGNPFIAAFDKETGKQIFLSEPGDEKEHISDYILGENEILLLIKNSIISISMHDGRISHEKVVPWGSCGKLQQFSVGQYYIQKDSIFMPIESLHPDWMHVVTDSMQLISLNQQFEATDTNRCKDLYLVYMTTDDYRFLNKDNTTLIINNDNKKVAELKASANATLTGNKLYDARGKTLVEYDLSSILNAPSIPEPRIENITSQQALIIIDEHQQDSSFVILDVRTPDEYNQGHLEDAVLMDYHSPDFKEKVNNLDRNKTYLVYCRRGGRSAGAMDIMKSMQFENVFNMMGGIESWTSAGYPVVLP